MRTLLKAAVVAAAVSITACAGSVDVHTVAAPDATLGHIRSFKLMQASPRHARSGMDANDPILVNSITNQSLRRDVAAELVRRGYVENDSTPDVLVAYYASTHDVLDLNAWNYGYGWRSGWARRGFGPMVSEYTQGSVVVDLVDPASRQLIWRGNGVARVSNQVADYTKDLRRTVTAIVDKLPAPAA